MPGELEVRSLTKRFGCRAVVDQVSFKLRPGEVTGYLGPNGSGKSTTIKMLTALIRPTDGEVRYGGERIEHIAMDYKRALGYVPEEPWLYLHLTGLEYLEMVGELRGLPVKKVAEKAAAFLRLFGLEGDRHGMLSSYSKGMRQKILLSAALLHDPEVVILDEPFSGLDVNSALVMRRLIQALGAEGKIVLYSSHVLEVVEKVCARVIILHNGKVRADESVGELRALMHLPTLEEIFSQLVIEQNTEDIARQMIDVMRS
jgi:ABC-2 type transport system ATP-binding protein